MGNKTVPRHGLHFERLLRLAFPVGGAHACGIFRVEVSDEEFAEVDGVMGACGL